MIMHKSNYDLIRVIVFLIFFLEDSKNSEHQLISEEELSIIQKKYKNPIKENLLSKFTAMKKNINSPQSTTSLDETIQNLCEPEGWFTEKVSSTISQRMESAQKKINNIFKTKWNDPCNLAMTEEQWKLVEWIESNDANYYKKNQVWHDIVKRKKSKLTYGDVATLLQEKETYIKNRNAPPYFNPILIKEFLLTRTGHICLVDQLTLQIIYDLLVKALCNSPCIFLHYEKKLDQSCKICGLRNYDTDTHISRNIFLNENTVYIDNGATTLLSNSNGNTTNALQQYAVILSLMQSNPLNNGLLDLFKKNYSYFIHNLSCQDLMPPLRKICYVRHLAKAYKNEEVENEANRIIDNFYTSFNEIEKIYLEPIEKSWESEQFAEGTVKLTDNTYFQDEVRELKKELIKRSNLLFPIIAKYKAKYRHEIDEWIDKNSIYFNIIYFLVKNKLPSENKDNIFNIVCQWIHSLYQSWQKTLEGFHANMGMQCEFVPLKDNLNPDIILQINEETTFKCKDIDLIQFENERLKKLNDIGLDNQYIVYQQIFEITKEIYTPPLKNQEDIAAQEAAAIAAWKKADQEKADQEKAAAIAAQEAAAIAAQEKAAAIAAWKKADQEKADQEKAAAIAAWKKADQEKADQEKAAAIAAQEAAAIAAQEKAAAIAARRNVLSLFCACCKKVLAFFVKFCQIFFKKK